MDKKQLFLDGEGDQYYLRNKEHLKDFISRGTSILERFVNDNISLFNKKINILEIGCCSGYNLRYLQEKLGDKIEMKANGIDPSLKAIEEGNLAIDNKYKECIKLQQGTSDHLPFEDESMDIVLIGFCLFWVDRKYLFKSISEADRVLRNGGIIVLEDFDTAIPYKRENVHNKDAYTYKMNYAKLFLANPQYYLLNKFGYSHAGLGFHTDIQERISTSILYKEDEETAYRNA